MIHKDMCLTWRITSNTKDCFGILLILILIIWSSHLMQLQHRIWIIGPHPSDLNLTESPYHSSAFFWTHPSKFLSAFISDH